MSRMIQVLKPDYFDAFSCVGSACPANCCCGWKIAIDKNTYEKYRRVKDPALAEKLRQNVKHDHEQKNAYDYAAIKMSEAGACPLMDEAGLCEVQKKCGLGYLSHTCQVYPRVRRCVDGVWETSLNLSCPEVSRLLLTRQEPLGFIQGDEKVSDAAYAQITGRHINTKAEGNAEKPIRYFSEMRELCIDILQTRALSIEERILAMGMFLRKAQDAQVDALPQVIIEYAQHLRQGAFAGVAPQQTAAANLREPLMLALINQLFQNNATNEASPTARILREFANALEITEKEVKISELAARVTSDMETYLVPYLRENPHIAENFFVADIFVSGFPFAGQDAGVYDNYVELVLHYALLKLLAAVLAGQAGTMDNALFTRATYALARTRLHNVNYGSDIRKLAEACEATSLAHLYLLL